MDEQRDQLIAALAAGQHGVFTLAQTRDVGFSPDQRKRRLATGRWELAHPGVYRMAGAPRTWRGCVIAACWGAQGLAVASHRCAAAIRDWPGGRTDLVEITCRRWKRAKASGLVVHETKRLDDIDFEIVDGIPTASVEQTLLGLAAVVSPTVLEMAVDRALYRRLTTIERLERFVQRKGKQGRNGVGVLRGLIDELGQVTGVPESEMETMLKQLLRRHGLPMPRFQFKIWHEGRFIGRVDAAYPEHRIAIEYDSYQHHIGGRAIDRDNERRAQLSGIDWETITFTASSIRRGGGAQLETLRRRLLGFGAAGRR
jgi:very-short-patch-repair endonuclease